MQHNLNTVPRWHFDNVVQGFPPDNWQVEMVNVIIYVGRRALFQARWEINSLNILDAAYMYCILVYSQYLFTSWPVIKHEEYNNLAVSDGLDITAKHNNTLIMKQ